MKVRPGAEPEPWVSKFLGIPYRSHGAARDGADCWGFVRVFYLEQYGIELPAYADRYSRPEEEDEVAALIEDVRGGWVQVSEPAPGDVVECWVRRKGKPCHVGIYAGAGRMLSIRRGLGRDGDSGDAAVGSHLTDLRSGFWRDRVMGFWRPQERTEWTLLARPSPFQQFDRLQQPQGATVANALRDAGVGTEGGGRLRVLVGDRSLPESALSGFRPKAGVTVSATVVPEDPVTLTAFFVAAANALAAAGAAAAGAVGLGSVASIAGSAIAGGIVGGLGLTGISALVATGFTVGLTGLVVGIGGVFALQTALSALTSAPESDGPSLAGPSRSPTANGVGNQERPYEPIPRLYGLHRVFPPVGAKPSTEFIGEERFWRLLLAVGVGRYLIDEIRVGGVPIEDIPGAQWYVREGGARGAYAAEVMDPEPLQDRPTGYWRLGDATGTTNAANEVSGGPTLFAVSVTFESDPLLKDDPGTSALLNGTTSRLTGVVSQAQLSDVTLEAWLDRTAAQESIVAHLGSASSGYAIGIDADGKVFAEFPGGAGKISSGILITNSQGGRGKLPTHVALRRTAGDTDGVWHLFVNGIKSSALTADAPVTPAAGFSVGAFSDATRFFGGEIQEVALYDVALTDEEILAHFDMGRLGSEHVTRGPAERIHVDTSYEANVNVRQEKTPWNGPPDPEYVVGDWVTRKIPGLSTELMVDLYFDSLFRLSENASSRLFSVGLDIEYREENETEWSKAVDSSTFNRNSVLVEQIGKGRALGPGPVVLIANTANKDQFVTPGGRLAVEQGTPDGGNAIQVLGHIRHGFPLGFRWEVPAGNYFVRLRKWTTDDGQARGPAGGETGASVNDFTILAYRGKLAREPIAEPGVATISLFLPLEAVGSTVDAVSCRAQALIQAYDPADPDADVNGFAPARVTRNAAWACLDLLRAADSTNPRPLSDSQVDLAAFADWATRARNLDLYVDFQSNVFDLFNLMAGPSKASLGFGNDGKYKPVEDRAGLTPVQLITPRTSRKFRGRKLWLERPHAIQARYIDEEADYTRQQVTVYDDGYSRDGSVAGTVAATKFETADVRGLVSRTAVREHIRFLLAAGRVRAEEWRVETYLDHLECERGSLVQFAHPAALIGVKWGRIIQVNVDGGGNATSVFLDESIVYDPALVYGCRIRNADGSHTTSDVVNPAGGSPVESKTVTFSSPIPPTPAAQFPALDAVLAVGERDEETVEAIVREVKLLGGHLAEVVLFPYAPEVFNAGEGPVDFDPTLTPPAPKPDLEAPGTPRILQIDSSEEFLLESPQFGLVSRMRVVLIPREGLRNGGRGQENTNPGGGGGTAGGRGNVEGRGRPDVFQVRFRQIGGRGLPTTPWEYSGWETQTRILVGPVDDGQLYEVQARAATSSGVSSPWSGPVFHDVIGKLSEPPAVTELRREDDQIQWEFDATGVLDLAGFRVRYRLGNSFGVGWESATPAHDGLVGDTEFPLSQIPRSGVVTVMVKAVDLVGNESREPASLVLNIGDPSVDNVVYTQDERALGWPGTLSGGTVIVFLVADLRPSGDANPVWMASDLEPQWDPDEDVLQWVAAGSQQMVYTTTFTPTQFLLGFPLTVEIVAVPTTATVHAEYRVLGPELQWGDDETALQWDPDDGVTQWGGWSAWRSSLLLNIQSTAPIEFRVTLEELSMQQARIEDIIFRVDLPDRVVVLNDVPISAAGSRLPVGAPFNFIASVNLTLQQIAGETAVGLRLVDRNLIGPLVQALDASGASVAATIDAEVKGY